MIKAGDWVTTTNQDILKNLARCSYYPPFKVDDFSMHERLSGYHNSYKLHINFIDKVPTSARDANGNYWNSYSITKSWFKIKPPSIFNRVVNKVSLP